MDRILNNSPGIELLVLQRGQGFARSMPQFHSLLLPLLKVPTNKACCDGKLVFVTFEYLCLATKATKTEHMHLLPGP